MTNIKVLSKEKTNELLKPIVKYLMGEIVFPHFHFGKSNKKFKVENSEEINDGKEIYIGFSNNIEKESIQILYDKKTGKIIQIKYPDNNRFIIKDYSDYLSCIAANLLSYMCYVDNVDPAIDDYSEYSSKFLYKEENDLN